MGQTSVWNIPYLRNEFFTGREEILEQLHARFQTGQATALSQRTAMCGLGGIGKTQIAVEYAYEHCDDYQSVLWTRAESHEALTSSFVEIAGLLDLPQKDEQDQTIIVQAVKRWLHDNTGWLLILDNADEPKVVREFLPTKFDGHMLLTTRAQALGGLAQRIEVDTLTPELGALFLLRRATLIATDGTINDAVQSDHEVAMQISEELGGLPLALDQAGAYIEETGCNLAKYLKLYQVQRAKLLKRRGHNSSDYPASVATTWSLSFERVEQNAIAADLLRLCAFLAPNAIPEEIVFKGASHLGEHLQGILEDEGLPDEAIAVLRAYSLIRRDPAEKTLSVHRLVQAVQRDAMSDEEAKMWAKRVVLAVSKACPTVEFAMWSQWERYLPHALVCADLVKQENLILVEATSLLGSTGYYLNERGQYAEAEPLLKHAFGIRERALGPLHPFTVTSLYNLALLYHNQGNYEQANLLLKYAFSISEQALGPLHPDTATSLNDLAGLYRAQGKYEQAELLYRRAIVIYERALGPLHPFTATSLNNLAVLYESQGKYEWAELLYRRAIAIYKQALGPLHRDTATSLNNLALLYKSQGKYEQAEPLLKHAFETREQTLGPLHRDTATSLNNLALLYKSQGKYEQAQPLLKRAFEIREQTLGPLHPNTATSLNNLALLYNHQGKYEQAQPLLKRALAIYEKALGPHHPNTQRTRQNYVTLLRAMGRDAEAKQLEEQQ